MRWLKKYQNETEYTTNKDEVPVPRIIKVQNTTGRQVKWGPEDLYKYEYLTFTALESGTFTLTLPSALTVAQYARAAYSLDDGANWTTLTNVASQSVTITTPTVNAGDKVLWRGYGSKMDTQTRDTNVIAKFSSTGQFNVSGNVLSMLYEDSFATQTTMKDTCGLEGLFMNCTGLINAVNLVLSASTLKGYDYMRMFYGCSSLITIPKLNAAKTILVCGYTNMFQNCTSLTEIHDLPATTLSGNYAYSAMFSGCTSLVKIPEILPVTSASGSYSMQYLFSGCTKLTKAPIIQPTGTLGSYAFAYMFNGCTNLVDASNITIPNIGTGGCQKMFYNCTKLTAPPIFNGTSVGNIGCANMFELCSSLVDAPTLPMTNFTGTFCYSNMFLNCTKMINVPTLPATTLSRYCYQYMFKGCTSLVDAPAISATTLADYCYYYMFNGCTKLVNAPSLPVTTLTLGCYVAMFSGCTSLTTAPDLPATTLVEKCYWSMFSGCTKLNYIKMLALNIDPSYCTNTWVYNITTTGTLVMNSNAQWYGRGKSTIPINWNIQYDGSGTSAQTYKDNFIASHTLEAATPNYLKTTALGNGNIVFNIGKGVQATTHLKNISWSKDGGVTWTTTANTNNVAKTITVAVTTGDEVLWKGEGYNMMAQAQVSANITTGNYSNFSSTCNFAVSGNILSLVDPLLQYNKMTDYTLDYGFAYLFYNCTGLISAENLIMPESIRGYGCSNMFDGCTNLTTPPALPATVIYSYCYQYMFQGCSSLTTAPNLPATVVYQYCYRYMFSGCTSLTTVMSSLPATSLESHAPQTTITVTTAPYLMLATYCYYAMFNGCSSLVTAPNLPATQLANNCYQYMFQNCTGLTTAMTTLPAMSLYTYVYQYMFNGCISLTTAPILPATACANYAYQYMFQNCSSLNYIKCMLNVTGTPSATHISNWVNGVAASGTFVKNSKSTKWTATGVSSIPAGWTVQTAAS